MRIYSKGISNQGIDFIVERVLKAYISRNGNCALVTLTDDNRNISELLKDFSIQESEKEFVDIVFSPTKIVVGLECIIADNKDRDIYCKLVDEFKIAFFTFIMDYYSKADVTRAEAVRIIWKALNSTEDIKGYDNIPTDVQLLILSYDEGAGNKKLSDALFSLIIKYSIYLTLWENRFSSQCAYNKIINRMCDIDAYVIEREPDIKTIEKNFKNMFSNEDKAKYKKETEEVRNIFSNRAMIQRAKYMQERIYNSLSLPQDNIPDSYYKFFYITKKGILENGKSTTIYTSLEGILLYMNYFVYSYTNKRMKMDFLLNESKHVGDISQEIEGILETAIEIVFQMEMLINNVPLEKMKDDIFAKDTMELHLCVLPIIQVILSSGEEIFDVQSILEKVKTEYAVSIKEIAVAKLKRMKEENYGAQILGSYYMFATSNQDGITGTDFKDVRSRAKRYEKQYWQERKKCLKKWDVKKQSILVSVYTEPMLEYIRLQNCIVRDKIREELSKFIKVE